MTIRRSTGLRNALLGTGSFRNVMAGCFMDIYSSGQPLSADDPPIGTLLMTFSLNHDGVTGLQWGTPLDGTLGLAPNQLIQGVGLVKGVGGWFRFRLAGDPNSSGTAYLRLDGSIAESGADLDMANPAVSVGGIRTLDVFQVLMPI